MRFLTSTLLYGVYASSLISRVNGESTKTDEEDEDKPTVFNGVEVPPLPELTGEKFNETVKDGYYFVKHYSYATYRWFCRY